MYCSKCGSSLADGSTFCVQCGQAALVSAAPAASAPALLGSPSAPVYVVSTGPGVIVDGNFVRISYAGFWLRFVAYLIDSVILGVLFIISLLAIIVISGIGGALSDYHSGEDVSDIAALFGIGLIAGYSLLVICGSWLYFAFCECSDWQGTPGKKMLGLRVTDLHGRRITFGRASGRYWAKWISSLIPLAIGYIMAGFTEKRQALHDMIASCLVLRND